MLKLFTAASAVVLGAGAAHAAVIDFEGFAHGEAINSVSAGGVTATVTVDSNGAVDQAVAFDTSLSGTADPDLEGPFTGTGATNPGKVLIISEDGGPDDERFGGLVTFEFSQPIDFLGFDAFDGGLFEVTSGMGDLFPVADLIVSGDNQSNRLTVTEGFQGVTFLNFSFMDSGEGASGAIDNIEFQIAGVAPIPVPAALPLLLAGLGGLGLVARRRRG